MVDVATLPEDMPDSTMEIPQSELPDDFDELDIPETELFEDDMEESEGAEEEPEEETAPPDEEQDEKIDGEDVGYDPFSGDSKIQNPGTDEKVIAQQYEDMNEEEENEGAEEEPDELTKEEEQDEMVEGAVAEVDPVQEETLIEKIAYAENNLEAAKEKEEEAVEELEELVNAMTGGSEKEELDELIDSGALAVPDEADPSAYSEPPLEGSDDKDDEDSDSSDEYSEEDAEDQEDYDEPLIDDGYEEDGGENGQYTDYNEPLAYDDDDDAEYEEEFDEYVGELSSPTDDNDDDAEDEVDYRHRVLGRKSEFRRNLAQQTVDLSVAQIGGHANDTLNFATVAGLFALITLVALSVIRRRKA